MTEPRPRHDPQFRQASAYGCWTECSCGWESPRYRTVVGAHLAFGQHLKAETMPG